MNEDNRQFLRDLGFTVDQGWWKHPTLGHVHTGATDKNMRYHRRRILKWLGLLDAPQEVIDHAYQESRVMAENWHKLLGGFGEGLKPSQIAEIEGRMVSEHRRLRNLARDLRQVPTTI